MFANFESPNLHLLLICSSKETRHAIIKIAANFLRKSCNCLPVALVCAPFVPFAALPHSFLLRSCCTAACFASHSTSSRLVLARRFASRSPAIIWAIVCCKLRGCHCRYVHACMCVCVRLGERESGSEIVFRLRIDLLCESEKNYPPLAASLSLSPPRLCQTPVIDSRQLEFQF